MWSVFTQLAGNVGVSFEWIVLFVFLFGGGIFCAKNFQIGMMMYFVGSAALFMWFYTAELNYVVPLIVMFMSLVILSLTFYASAKVSEKGGFT